jgi:hypothetical protein
MGRGGDGAGFARSGGRPSSSPCSGFRATTDRESDCSFGFAMDIPRGHTERRTKPSTFALFRRVSATARRRSIMAQRRHTHARTHALTHAHTHAHTPHHHHHHLTTRPTGARSDTRTHAWKGCLHRTLREP